MSNPPTAPRRLAIAISAAVASTTLAVGVTAGSLLGWFGPTAPSPTSSVPLEPAAAQPVILVPITPAPPAASSPPATLAMHDDDERDHDERHEHDDRGEDDDE